MAEASAPTDVERAFMQFIDEIIARASTRPFGRWQLEPSDSDFKAKFTVAPRTVRQCATRAGLGAGMTKSVAFGALKTWLGVKQRRFVPMIRPFDRVTVHLVSGGARLDYRCDTRHGLVPYATPISLPTP